MHAVVYVAVARFVVLVCVCVCGVAFMAALSAVQLHTAEVARLVVGDLVCIVPMCVHGCRCPCMCAMPCCAAQQAGLCQQHPALLLGSAPACSVAGSCYVRRCTEWAACNIEWVGLRELNRRVQDNGQRSFFCGWHCMCCSDSRLWCCWLRVWRWQLVRGCSQHSQSGEGRRHVGLFFSGPGGAGEPG